MGIILMQCVCTADGAAAVEALRAELAQVKEQAQASNVAALKAAKDLRSEQAAHRRSEEKIAEMAVELKNAADWYAILEKENKASSAPSWTRHLMPPRRCGPRSWLRARTYCGRSSWIRSMLPLWVA